jgi:solute carrier family 25 (mitochondrial iron transporter), member 28/37
MEDPLEFEEWDGRSPFWHHCVAGSLAGVAEHVLVYPLDTVKTHIQCAECPRNNTGVGGTSSKFASAKASKLPHGGMWTTMRHIVSQPSIVSSTAAPIASSTAKITNNLSRLWRGAPTVLVGCVPAHALYFSFYETIKYYGKRPDGTTSPLWGALAGAAAVLGHDIIMSPLDTIKQRLQLGHYSGMGQAVSEMYLKENGFLAFYRSFPITLVSNIPYGMVMVGSNEFIKDRLQPSRHQYGAAPSLAVCLAASSFSGMMAAAATTPLDRIKTVLQTQHLTSACTLGECPRIAAVDTLSLRQAIEMIVKQEGMLGFFKGMAPRVASHTPAVAISWTTYETAKQWLKSTA